MRLRNVCLAGTFAMGLELVEIVLDVEKTFGIRLPHTEGVEISTVGQLYDCIVKTLSEKQSVACLTSRVFYRLRNALQSARGLARRQIRPSTPLERIISLWARRTTWKKLEQALAEHVPALRRPRLLSVILAVVAIVLGWLCTFGLVFESDLKRMIARPAIAFGCVFFFVPAAAFFGLVGLWLTAPLAVVLPAGIRTVGDLARVLVSMNYGDPAKKERQWSTEEVWGTLRNIIVDVLPIDPGEVTREARFVEDLGAG